MHLRSIFFGGLAMLAAAMFMHAPARAIDNEPAHSVSFEWPDFAPLDARALVVADMRSTEVANLSSNSHAVAFAIQNQPLTAWRFAVDANLRIDPHIRAG
ncbi:hypothetical protein [Aliihoeflea sp. 40Bstr573]|uniref:hypothetical protein n=1 Tax=Aliihoeflea sp. 40Bstr573 TaxID=2696467 RepID=UPI002095C616|nr:hypothetical protein [Aliihoeflea sp. 40Bstr573]MCO6389349.1 hypothetical protein [Aliihoeflea sp. 40Bstr573]